MDDDWVPLVVGQSVAECELLFELLFEFVYGECAAMLRPPHAEDLHEALGIEYSDAFFDGSLLLIWIDMYLGSSE